MRYTKYFIWGRKTNDPDALWFEMEYAGRSKADCEAIADYYRSAWNGIYEYQVILGGFYPQGTREPNYAEL